MGTLIRFELEKLFRKKIVYVTLAIFGVVYAFMMYSWIFGSEWAVTPEGKWLYGEEAAAYNEDITLRYQGPLTDEKVQEILREFPRLGEATTGDVSNHVYYPVATLFAQSDGSWNGKTVSQVFPDFEEPPMLGMATRWESFLYSMLYMVMLAGIVLIIVVSPIFSDEYSSGMDALILTSRYGRQKCAAAKLIASFVFAFAYVTAVLGLGFLAFYGGRGAAGWDADIQLTEMMLYTNIPYSLKCWQAAAAMAGLSIFSILTLNGMVLVFSAVSRTPFVSIIASAVAYIAPMFFNPGEMAVKRLVLMLPVNAVNVAAILNLGEIGRKFFMVWAVGILMRAVMVCSVVFCRRTFSRHQVA